MRRRKSVNPYLSPRLFGYRVDSKYSLGLGIDSVVGDYEHSLIDNNRPVKIMQDEESREKKPGTPEGIRNPNIHIIIRTGRRVIGNHRRSVIIVIIVD